MAAAQPVGDEPLRLTEGSKLRCPKCLVLGYPGREFKPLEMCDQFKRELNPVYVHAGNAGNDPAGKRCGHAFSPGDPWIIEAYLAGDLVPKSSLQAAEREAAFLRVQLEEMRSASPKEVVHLDDEERRDTAA